MLRLWKKAAVCLLAVIFLFSCPVRAENESLTYRFTSIDGKSINNETNAGKVALIVFMHMSSSHSDAGALIQMLVDAQWSADPNLAIVVADCMGATAEQIRQFTAPYADAEANIAFCADEGGMLFTYMEKAGLPTDSYSVPVCFVVDQNGNIRASMAAEHSENSFRKLLAPYLNGIEPAAETTLAVNGENVYSEAFEIVELINLRRQENGLPPVKMDKALLESAMLRAAECSVYYSHTRPNGTQCFTAFPTAEGSSGENIAIGQQSAEDVMDGWMNSPGHRANILSKEFNSVGVGVFCHQGIYTWVQLFSSNTAQTAKKGADTEKNVNVEVLQEHLTPSTERSLLMLKKGAEKSVCLRFINKEFDFQYVQPDTSCLRFHSSDPGIAAVDAKGVVAAVAEGTALITVTLDGTEKKAVIEIVVTEHNYDEWQYEASTCSASGSARYRCLDCGQWLDKEVTQLQAHSWDGGTVTRKPTTDIPGERCYTCTVCGETKLQSIPKYEKPKPTPTVPPTEPATKAPTAAPATAAPTTPPATEQSIPATRPVTVATDPTEIPIPIPEPTETTPASLPAPSTEGASLPVESTPEFRPTQEETQGSAQSTQAATQPPAEEDAQAEEDTDNALTAAIIVTVAAILATGVFLLFWKRKNK